ncbi:hypothetical protein SBOR_9832 [Sclerotinia borealis F-4128]|uniref:Uncharacterized protein n=1 Tax=Sclerotinia borealis (strain F-4128) TaxID=1432307 RepID=W9C1K2_SCLBF|nr:hypothetical protein SBOR_9832 [Sclerotinia borealis F-4128]
MPTYSTIEKFFVRRSSQQGEGNVSLFADVDILPVGASTRAEFEKGVYNHAEFETLETYIIVPTPEYITESMGRPNIETYLGSHYRRKKIYMITGLKIAKQGRVWRGDRYDGGGGSQFGNQPMLILPASLGLDLRYKRGVDEEVSSSPNDFVWAFNLRRIYYRKGLLVKSDTFANGATFAEDDEWKHEEEHEQKSSLNDKDSTVEGMDEKDFDEGFRHESWHSDCGS